MRVGDNRLCDAAQDQPLEAGPSVRPDDDQIRLPFVSSIDDRGSGITFANCCFDRQPGCRDSFTRSSCELLGIGRLAFSNLFQRRGSKNELGRGRRVRLNH